MKVAVVIPLDVPALCFLPVTDSLWFNVFVLTEVYFFYTGKFILGQQPCAELAVREEKKKKKIGVRFRFIYVGGSDV